MPGELLRSFIAGDLPPEIQQAISQCTNELRKDLPKPLVRWVAPENIHLTFQFLGDVPPGDLEKMAAALKPELTGTGPIPITVSRIGAFPNPRRARVLWVGLVAPPSLAALHQRIVTVTSRLGQKPEERGFSPHLTIGRVNRNVSAADLQRIHACLGRNETSILGTFQVDAVHIYKSDLAASGPTYTRLYSIPLLGKP